MHIGRIQTFRVQTKDQMWMGMRSSRVHCKDPIFPEKKLRGILSPNFHIRVSVGDLYIPMIDLPILLREICGPILVIYKSFTHTNVEIGTEALQFPEKEYINGIFVAVWLERLSANAEVATALGSIPASSDTVESEGLLMNQC